jgi:predicted O-methyltransferase YrrM
MNTSTKAFLLFCFLLLIWINHRSFAQQRAQIDQKVKKFLTEKKHQWRDLNVPFEDGKVLHDLIVDKGYTSAVEVGTSTGHSTIWIAWALSKTGGKLITIEIDEKRQKQAIANLKEVGLLEYVDFRLGDGHQIVKELKGPIDFVFLDADKDWYSQYFKDLDNKIPKGGMFTAHNVLNNISGIREFMRLIQDNPRYETRIDRSSSSGISISIKK